MNSANTNWRADLWPEETWCTGLLEKCWILSIEIDVRTSDSDKFNTSACWTNMNSVNTHWRAEREIGQCFCTGCFRHHEFWPSKSTCETQTLTKLMQRVFEEILNPVNPNWRADVRLGQIWCTVFLQNSWILSIQMGVRTSDSNKFDAPFPKNT